MGRGESKRRLPAIAPDRAELLPTVLTEGYAVLMRREPNGRETPYEVHWYIDCPELFRSLGATRGAHFRVEPCKEIPDPDPGRCQVCSGRYGRDGEGQLTTAVPFEETVALSDSSDDDDDLYADEDDL